MARRYQFRPRTASGILPIGRAARISMIAWQRIGVCSTVEHIERYWHAGLNADGSRMFVSSVDDEYLVWDVSRESTVWRDHEQPDPDALRTLDAWLVDGYIDLVSPTLTDRFRIFGLHHHHGLLMFGGQAIDTDVVNHNLVIRDSSGNTQTLPFEAFSGDWAFASFSDHGNIIAVVEPYDVTLYGPVSR